MLRAQSRENHKKLFTLKTQMEKFPWVDRNLTRECANMRSNNLNKYAIFHFIMHICYSLSAHFFCNCSPPAWWHEVWGRFYLLHRHTTLCACGIFEFFLKKCFCTRIVIDDDVVVSEDRELKQASERHEEA